MDEQVSLERCVIHQSCPATPADVVAVVVAVPAELHGGAVAAFGGSAVHPAADSDEAELAGPVAGEVDEPRFDEVYRVAVPQVHLHDSPSTGQTPHRTSPWFPCRPSGSGRRVRTGLDDTPQDLWVNSSAALPCSTRSNGSVAFGPKHFTIAEYAAAAARSEFGTARPATGSGGGSSCSGSSRQRDHAASRTGQRCEECADRSARIVRTR
jgi:hypothetical protein